MSYLFMKAIYMKPVVGKIYNQYHLYGRIVLILCGIIIISVISYLFIRWVYMEPSCIPSVKRLFGWGLGLLEEDI